MPMIRARRLCPHAVYLPNDFTAYSEYSERIKDVFLSFTPLVEPLSLDEAFLDVSGSVKLFGTPVDMARKIKAATREFGLTCTVGVAPNKFLAKLASGRGKPDGLLVVEAGKVRDFLDPLPVTALWGVGEATGEQLRRLGLKIVADIRAVGKRTLERAIGEAMGAHLHALAHGLDERPVVPHEAARSVGSEETFSSDLDATEDILREILRLSDRTAGRLRAKGLCGRTVTLKVRFSNFSTITRSRTLDGELDSGAEIYEVVKDLYLRLDPDRPRIRLLGVAVTGLAEGRARRQLDLLAPPGAGWPEATTAIDSIRDRFGQGAVGPAALLEPE